MEVLAPPGKMGKHQILRPYLKLLESDDEA